MLGVRLRMIVLVKKLDLKPQGFGSNGKGTSKHVGIRGLLLSFHNRIGIFNSES